MTIYNDNDQPELITPEERARALRPRPTKKGRSRSSAVVVISGVRTYVKPEYQTYISSDGWKQRKADYFAKHPRRCTACGSESAIHLHHRTYARMGRELNEDLTPLCQPCHSKVHQHHEKSRKSLAKATDEFIRRYRSGAQKRGDRKKSRRVATQTVTDQTGTFLPKNLRGARSDRNGRMISAIDWRTEVRGIRTDR